ncbi:hypothetical protein [Terricaulis sp.]|uniref:hypothetical protein n=1 Tax=Terricaulis sp. TaxID=2768686 RepID=UPI003784BC89
MAANTYNWQGASNRWYEFDVARAQRDWEPVGGVYMFVKPNEPNVYEWGGPVCLFIAKTHDFSQTLARHEWWQAAQNLGAAEIHLLAIRDEEARARVEKDILEAQTPILNRNMLRRVA